MKIGILTFHWGTNYGAVLQSYALQTYLESQGHDVEIINYKPHQYDDSIWTFIRFRKFLHLKNYFKQKHQEAALEIFRKEHLKMTKRYCYESELTTACSCYNAIISGSDQVMNPSFLFYGESGQSTVYFIGFPYTGKRIAYAASFGCIEYPRNALKVASKLIPSFDFISVRESSGLKIVKQMGFENPLLVPDPTILLDKNKYLKMTSSFVKNDYTFMFFIRNKNEYTSSVKVLLPQRNFIVNNEDGTYSLESWLSKIHNANLVITDSFHCVVLSLFFNVPFIVVTKERGMAGMNDRLFTLLEKCGIPERIVAYVDIIDLPKVINRSIDWERVNNSLIDYRDEGILFLKSICK